MRHHIFRIFSNLIFIVSVCLALCCCDSEEKRVEDILSEAEKTLDDQPLRVSTQLDSLQKTELNEYEVNRVKLLRARLQWKEDSLPQTDSIISKLLDYFRNIKDEKHIMHAAFVKAIIERNNLNYVDAVGLLCDALDIANEINDPFWKGRVHDQLSSIFFDRGCYYLAYNIAFVASREYLEAKDTLRSKFSCIDAAHSAHGLVKGERTIEIIDSLLNLPAGKTFYDTTFECHAYQVQLQSLVENHQYSKADSAIKKLNSNPYYVAYPEYVSEEAILRARQHFPEKAKILADSSLLISKDNIGKMYAHDAIAEYAKEIGDYKSMGTTKTVY